MPDPVVTGLFALAAATLSGILTWMLNQARARVELEKLKLEVQSLEQQLRKAELELKVLGSKKTKSEHEELAILKAEFRRKTPAGGWAPHGRLSPPERKRLRRLGIDPDQSRKNLRRVVREVIARQIRDQNQPKLSPATRKLLYSLAIDHQSSEQPSVVVRRTDSRRGDRFTVRRVARIEHDRIEIVPRSGRISQRRGSHTKSERGKIVPRSKP